MDETERKSKLNLMKKQLKCENKHHNITLAVMNMFGLSFYKLIDDISVENN